MLFFIGGLFLGSLLNNIACRIEKEEDFVYSRSKCPKCDHILFWGELVPILSFIAQKGRCRGCKKKISFQYPISEIVVGLMTFGIAHAVLGAGGGAPEFLYLLFFFSCFFVVALLDLKTTYIDERVVYASLLGWLIFRLVFPSFRALVFSGQLQYFFLSSGTILSALSTGLIASLFFLTLYAVSFGKGVGLGDAKIAFMIGLFLHPADAVLSLALAILLGGIAGIYLLFKYRQMKREVPYVPFLFLGTLFACIYGSQIVSFYLRATL